MVSDHDFDHVSPHARLELADGAGRDRGAVVDDDDVVGQLVGLVEVVRGEQHVGAGGDQASHCFPNLDAAGRVESGRRFVEQQQPWCADQTGSEVETAPLATGVGAAAPVGDLAQSSAARSRLRLPVGPPYGNGRRSARSSTRFSRPVRVGSTAAC